MNNILSYKFFKTGLAWIILIIGIGGYIWGYWGFEKDSIWKEVVIKLSDVLVIGVIVGYLSNAAQFLGVFKQDLQDIIYGKEFIQQRKDIYPLWETVSKQMFKNKFPVIHKDFLKVINNYFPKEEISYYNDYERKITIDWVDRDKGIIKAIDNVSFDLIAETTDRFMFPIKSWTKSSKDSVYENKMVEFLVNGKRIELNNGREDYKNDEIFQEYEIELKGNTKYEIQYMREKIYDINEDYYIGFQASYIVNKLRVCLDLPEDIDAIFTCRGTQLDFEDIKNSNNQHRIEKKYKGIILPRQGYLFALRKLN